MLKLLWNKISGAFLTVIAIAIGSMALFFYGKHKGKEGEKNKQTKDSLNEILELKQDEAKRLAHGGVAAARKRLRDSAIDR